MIQRLLRRFQSWGLLRIDIPYRSARRAPTHRFHRHFSVGCFIERAGSTEPRPMELRRHQTGARDDNNGSIVVAVAANDPQSR